MLVTLGWMLVAGLPLIRFTTIPDGHPPTRVSAGGRVAVWTDRDDPYARDEGARVYLRVDQPAYVAVFRVDTDGRISVLFPREPWGDTYVRDRREFEIAGSQPDRSFVVDDDPGMGYLFAVAAAEPFDFRDLSRGDYWDYRLIGDGRIRGDPYVTLTDLAARIVPRGDYDYDISPYHVGRRYDYPRFVCYDCHAYAGYREWDPYRTPCTRYRVVIRDDPRYYPYRYGGRNVVADRPAHPGPRFVFRDTDPRREPVSRAEPERRTREPDLGRTSEDVGERGAVPAPGLPTPRRDRELTPERTPARPVPDDRRRARPADRPGGGDTAHDVPDGLRPSRAAPRSTGEPELRRRRP